MKNPNAKTMIVLILSLIICLYANANIVGDSVPAAQKPVKIKLSEQKKNKQEKKQETCLRVIGSALDEDGFPVTEMEVTLFKDNEELAHQKITHGKISENLEFFGLTRNSHYSILISKEGYVPRLISISTDLPDDIKTWRNVFVFEFEVMLYETNDTDDSNYTDFPIAIISYNPVNGVFENHEHYTQHIKEKIQGKAEGMAVVKE